MRIDEVTNTQHLGKRDEKEEPTRQKRKDAIKSYKDVDKLKPRDDDEFTSIKVTKGK